MGQSVMKLATGLSEENKVKEIGPLIEECYNVYFSDHNKVWSMADFYRAICQTVEDLNKRIGGTQFRVPSKEVLEKAFKPFEKKEDDRGLFFWTARRYSMVPHDYNNQDHHESKGSSLTKEEFRKILKDVMHDTGLLGTGAKDIILFIFGVPMAALLIKQTLAPKAIRNEVLIPGVTSAAVFVLARMNKI